MANLTVTALDVTDEPIAGVAVSAVLTDSVGRSVTGHLADGTIVQSARGRTDGTGTVVLDLTPNASIQPPNTYYTLHIGQRTVLIEKGAGAESVLDAVVEDETSALAAIRAAHIDTTVDVHGLADGVLTETVTRSRQHSEQARGLDAGLGALEAGTGVLRVLIAGDSMVELSAGFAGVAEKAQDLLDGSAGGTWFSPSWVLWPFVDTTYAQGGTAGTHGLDGYGRILTSTDSVGSPTTAYLTGDRLDVFYTARSGGGSFVVEVDGSTAATVDTSLLEDGVTAATTTTQGQLKRVTLTPGLHTIEMVNASGTSWLDGYYLAPASGVEWQGMGRSGTNSPTIRSGGGLVAHVQAMVDRSEDPHLIILHADTAEVVSDATFTTASTAVSGLVADILATGTNATIAHVIPSGHNAISEANAERWTGMWRELHADLGVLTIDTWQSLGHVGNAYDPRGLSDDGVHLHSKGQAVADATMADVILSRTVRPSALTPTAVWRPVGRVRYAQDFIDTDVTTGVPAGWTETVSGANASVTQVATLEEEAGVCRISTGTTTTGFAYMAQQYVAVPRMGTGEQLWRIRRPVAPAAGETFTVYAGLISGLFTGGVWVGAEPGDTNWHVWTGDGATATKTDSGVAIGTGWVWVRLVRNQRNVVAYVGDGAVAITAGLPTTAGSLTPQAWAVKSAGTSARFLDVDWMSLDHQMDR
jgi:hypothetical protein